jgi:hypothetical protein
MSTPHRATPEQWANIERWGSAGPWDGSSCILELRARIEALEAAQLEAAMTELRAASAEAQLGGLVERVRDAMLITQSIEDIARAAIREVAKWLRAGRMLHAAELLEQETDR